MRHLAGYLQSIDPAGAFTAVTPLADSMLFIQGTNIRVPSSVPRILWAAGGADGVQIPRWRLTSPSLIARGRPEIKPLSVTNAASVEPDSPLPILDMRSNPMTLLPDELLFAELNSNPAAPQVQWLMIEFCDEVPAAIVGAEVRHSRWTSGTAATALQWTTVVCTPDDALQPGEYAVVGLRPQSTTMIAARFIFQTDPLHRPGAMGCDLAQDVSASVFRDGNYGVWGTFPFTQTPTIEVLCTAADAAAVIEFEVDLVKIG